MKKHLLTTTLFILACVFTFAQDELIIDEFTGNTSSGIGEAAPQPDWGSGVSVIDYESDQLKSDYTWTHADWYPRAVWYNFDDYQDLSQLSVLNVKFMVTDLFNDSIPVRLDLFGDGAEPYNDTIRAQMETNGNPWELWATNGEWYDVSDDFLANNRFFCTYWNGGIPATRIDSTRINGFEAFAHYGDAQYNDQAGTLFIDYIKMTKTSMTGTEEHTLFSSDNAFAVAVYPNPAAEFINVNAENIISSVNVFDIVGKSVLSINESNRKILQVNVSDLNKGIYLMNIEDVNGNSVNKKFTVE
jgi:hypothetical protein